MAGTLQAACGRAAVELTPFSQDDRVKAVITKIRTLGESDEDAQLQKSLAVIERERVKIRKGEVEHSPGVSERLDKAAAVNQLEHLRRVSPKAAAAYEESRAGRDG